MITLEPIDLSHLPFLQQYAEHPQIGATSNVPFPYPEHAAIQRYGYISKKIETNASRVFAIKFENAFCGVMSLNNFDLANRTAGLDYWVAVEYQGKGIATQAVAAAVNRAKDTLDLEALYSSSLSRNLASARVLEKNGFKEYAQSVLDAGKFSGETVRKFKLEIHNMSTNPTRGAGAPLAD